MVQISSYAVAVMVLMSASYGASMPADMINDAFNQVSGCKIFPDGRKSCSLEQGSWMDGLSGCKLDLENARACCADHAGNQTCGSIDSLDDIDADELTEIDTVGSWWRKVADKCKINWAKKEVCCTFKYGRVCGGLTAANPNIDNVEIAEEFYSELSTIKDAVHEDAAIEDAAIEDADITENLGAWWVPIAKHCRIHFFKKSVCCKVGRVRVCGGLKAENPNIDDAEVAEEFYSELATFKDASVEEAQVNESLEAWWTPIAKHCTLNIFTKTACCTVKKVKVCGSLKAVNPNAEDIEDYQDMLETVALEAESTELANLEGKWWEKFKKNCTFDFAAGSVCCKTPLGKICGSLNSAENPMAEDLEYSNELEIVDDEGFTELSNLEGKWWEKFKKNCTFDFAAQSVCCKTPLGRVCGSLNSSLANPFTSQDNPFASVEDEFESFSEELFMEDGGDVTTELIEGSRYNKWFKRCKINRKTKTICCKKSEKKEKKDKKDEDEKSQLEKREKKDKKDKKEKSKKDTKCFKLKPRRRRSNPKPKPSPTPRPRPTPKPATLSMGSEETSSISALNSLMASGNVDETINVDELNEMIANLDGIELEFENGARIVSEETLEALENINAGSNYNVAYLYAALAAGILVLGAAGGLVFKKVAAKTAAKNAYSDSEDKKADLLDNYHDVADVSDAAVTV